MARARRNRARFSSLALRVVGRKRPRSSRWKMGTLFLSTGSAALTMTFLRAMWAAFLRRIGHQGGGVGR